MIDVNLLRQQPELIKTALKNRQKDTLLADQVLEFDKSRREILSQVEDLRSNKMPLVANLKANLPMIN